MSFWSKRPRKSELGVMALLLAGLMLLAGVTQVGSSSPKALVVGWKSLTGPKPTMTTPAGPTKQDAIELIRSALKARMRGDCEGFASYFHELQRGFIEDLLQHCREGATACNPDRLSTTLSFVAENAAWGKITDMLDDKRVAKFKTYDVDSYHRNDLDINQIFVMTYNGLAFAVYYWDGTRLKLVDAAFNEFCR